jgi:DNA-binding HxlR family transcriptional regulator
VSTPAAHEDPSPALRVIRGGTGCGRTEPTDREMIEATTAAVALFSAKWKVDLLFLLAAGVRRHGRLNDHLLVSKKVLSETLKALERDGLVRRQVFAERPVRVEYSLTPLGRSLTGPLFAIWEWSNTHFEAVIAARHDCDSRNGGAPDTRDERPRFSATFQIRSEIAS